MPSLIRRLLALGRAVAPGNGPPGEGTLARYLRRRRDCTRLTGLDDRLLRDMGLRREVSPAGLDIVPLASADPGGPARPAKPLQDNESWSAPPPRRTAALPSTGHDRAVVAPPFQGL